MSAAPKECKIALSLDRSLSIGSELPRVKNYVKGLLDRLSPATIASIPALSKLQGIDLDLGFWTFSHEDDPSANYNLYSSDFVRIGGASSPQNDFRNKVDDITLDGQTNYEQAVGYNNGSPNSRIANIQNNANLLIVITDGLPNYPGNADPDLSTPVLSDSEKSARAAVLQLQGDHPDLVIAGGTIGVSQQSMNYALNGDRSVDTDSTGKKNVGPLEFEDIQDYIVSTIVEKCGELVPTGYSITPTTGLDSTAVRSGGSVNVTRTATLTENLTGGALTTAWSVVRVVLQPGQDERKIQFGLTGSSCGSASNPYCDSMDCSQIKSAAYYGSGTDCTAIETCATACYNYITDGNPDEAYTGVKQDTVPDGLELGTKVCYMLALNSPANGKSNRYSQATCVTIGKSPTVQVWGGDVRVGRTFSDDSSGRTIAADAGVYTSTFTMPDNKLYGAWAEYGVYAPKAIKSIASMAGLAEGFMGSTTGTTGNATCDTSALNRLTFANAVAIAADTCGQFGQMGSIPNVVATYAVRPLATGSPIANTGPIGLNSNSGRYQVDGAADVHLAAVTIDAGKQIVLDARGRNVIIDGDIQYADEKSPGDTYKNVGEIPQLVIIAKNITVSAGAKRVDAWLIADGKTEDAPGIYNYRSSQAADGTVMTCEPKRSPSGNKEVTAAMCNDPLRINGPVMARHLELWRTAGADDKSPSCDKAAATPNCPGAKDPAEVIDLPGTTLMWSALPPASPMALTTYSVELPPYF